MAESAGNSVGVEVVSPLPFLVEGEDDADEEGFGRYLVAKQFLEMGQLILVEEPTVHGPSRDSPFACLGCYASIPQEALADPGTLTRCSKCSLPLCSEECQSQPQHQPECQAFAGARRSPVVEDILLSDLQADLLHEVVLVLRCLALRDSDVSGWIDLTSLQSHLEMRDPDSSEMGRRAERVADFILLGRSTTSPLVTGDVDRDLILEVCGILDVNSFEVPTGAPSDVVVQAVYAKHGCLVEHNCVPTAHRSFGGVGGPLSLCLRAAAPMEPGDHISVTYTDSLWPTAERRQHLMLTKYFECLCLRCCDPKELNTYLSALRCPRCHLSSSAPTGYLLPVDPLHDGDEEDDEDNGGDWECQGCQARFPGSFAAKVNQNVAETLHLVEASGLSPEKCEKFIMAHLAVLHPSHAHMLDMKHSLLHLLGHSEGHLMADLTEGQLCNKEAIAKELLKIAEALLPGISRLKGTTLYELFLTLQQKALNWKKTGQRSLDDSQSAFKEAEAHLTECIITLQYEPSNSPEGKLCTQAREELKILQDFLSIDPLIDH